MSDGDLPHSQTETVGERLRRLRTERGLSQRELSAPGISYAYISRIEAGARTPSVKALRMLAQKLSVSAGYLETGSHLDDAEARELRLAELELRLRLDRDVHEDELDDVLAEARAAADDAAAARTLAALGALAAAHGSHAEAAERYEQAVASGALTAATRPDVYLALAHALAAAGSARRAVEVLERGLAELAELAPGDRGTRIRFNTYLSYALTDLGELARARAVVSETLFDAGGAVDPYTRVRLHWSLGRIAIEQANGPAALDSFRRAIALLEVSDDTLHVARAHLACAEAAMISGADDDAATRHLDEAWRLLRSSAEGGDLAVLHRLRALDATRGRRFREAEESAQRALEFAVEIPNEYGQAWWAIAQARAGAGDPSADDAFQRAIDVLHEHGTVRNYANTLRSYGRYLREVGRESDALDVFERAANVASNLQAEPSAAERERS